MNISIRSGQSRDIEEVSKLYFNTVNIINSKDYNKSQINVWSSQAEDKNFWLKRWNHCFVYVAEIDSQIAGFAELKTNGEIDCFYVHHEHQGKSIGKLLMIKVIEKAKDQNIDEVFANVSVTAKPFFIKMGFIIEKEQVRILKEEKFQQYLMKQKLSSE